MGKQRSLRRRLRVIIYLQTIVVRLGTAHNHGLMPHGSLDSGVFGEL